MEEITPEQFALVKQDIEEQAKIAVNKAYKVYKNFPEKIKKRLEKALGVKNFDEVAKKPVPGYPGLTFGDVFAYADKIEKEDFLPSHLHLTPIGGGALGMCAMNSDEVFYAPRGRAWDFVRGWPSVLAHEFTHNNVKLQKMPASWQWDVELETSYTELEGGYTEVLDYLMHPYLDSLRFVEEVYFSFKVDKVMEQILTASKAGNYEFIENKLEKLIPTVRALKTTFNEILPELFQEYYANPYRWNILKEKLNDPQAWLHLMVATKYNPTLLKEKGQMNKGDLEDLKFLRELKESGKLQSIMKGADKRMEDSKKNPQSAVIGGKYKDLKNLSKLIAVDPITRNIWLKRFKEKGLERITEQDLEMMEWNVDQFFTGGLR